MSQWGKEKYGHFNGYYFVVVPHVKTRGAWCPAVSADPIDQVMVTSCAGPDDVWPAAEKHLENLWLGKTYGEWTACQEVESGP